MWRRQHKLSRRVLRSRSRKWIQPTLSKPFDLHKMLYTYAFFTTCGLQYPSYIYRDYSLHIITNLRQIYSIVLNLFMEMASVPLIAVLCVSLLPLAAMAIGTPFHIEGCVYCDTCRFGFETVATKYIIGLYLYLHISILLIQFPLLSIIWTWLVTFRVT